MTEKGNLHIHYQASCSKLKLTAIGSKVHRLIILTFNNSSPTLMQRLSQTKQEKEQSEIADPRQDLFCEVFV